MKNHLLLLPLVCLWLLACSSGQKQLAELAMEKVPLSHAEGFSVFKGKDFWVLEVNRAFAGQEQAYRYLIWEEGAVPSAIEGFDAVLSLPVSQVVLTSTTHVPHLEYLRALDKFAGFPGLDHISSVEARKLIRQGKVRELGSGAGLNVEQAIDLEPDWLMVSTLGQDLQYLDLLKKAGIPAFLNGEYLEQHPLGRAEWLKFTGLLLGKWEESLQAFEKIEEAYLSASLLAENLEVSKPSVMSGVMYKDVWYVPGSESWAAKLFQAAGADYVFEDQEGAGSVPLSYEFVLDRAKEVEFWIGVADFASLEQLAKADPRYAHFRAFKEGKVFTYTLKKGETGGMEYFELGYLRPDLILQDLIKILHPEALPTYETYFYQKLHEK